MSPLACIWRVLFFTCVVEGSVRHKEAAMRGFILHQSNPPCRDVNANNSIPCTLTGQEDYQKLRSVNSANPSTTGELKISCKDGSNNMTCLPLSLAPVRYFCACDSEKGDLNTDIEWMDIWDYFGPISARRLCDSHDGWCLNGMFKTNQEYQEGYLVENYVLLASQITVSSEFGSSYTKERVRVKDYGAQCGWLKADSDSSPWVQFDLLQTYTAVGLLLRKRCDTTYGDQHVTTFSLSSSPDDVTWSYVGTDVQAVYEGEFATWRFGRAVSARYWKIFPLSYNIRPFFQADIIGYLL